MTTSALFPSEKQPNGPGQELSEKRWMHIKEFTESAAGRRGRAKKAAKSKAKGKAKKGNEDEDEDRQLALSLGLSTEKDGRN